MTTDNTLSRPDNAAAPSFSSESEGAAAFPSSARLVLVFLFLLTAFRLWYGSRLGLANDEAYYWQWSRHPDLSYYDQGPGIAVIIRIGTALFGPTHLGIRFVPILLAAGTTWFAFLTARRWLGERVALWSIALLNIAPILFAGSILATYDSPQVFFWAASIYALTRTVQENRIGGWYLVGLLVGLGSLCKITMLLFAPCVLAFLLLSPTYRRWLLTPHPYIAFVLALALYLPVIIWNAQHEWMGFLHSATLSNRTRNAKPFRWFGDFLGGQAIALGPFLFLAELYALGRLVKPALGRPSPPRTRLRRVWPPLPALRQREEEPEGVASNAPSSLELSPPPSPAAPGEGGRGGEGNPSDALRFLLAFGAPVLLVCMTMALRSKQEINWPAPTHIAGLMAVGLWFSEIWQRGRAAGRVAVAGSMLFSAAMAVVMLFPGVLPALGIHPTGRMFVKPNEPYGWPQIAARIQEARQTLEAEGEPVFVFGLNYRTNSIVAFYLPDKPETKALYLNSRRDQYWIWTDHKSLVGQNAVFYLDDENEDAVNLARRYFGSVEALPPVVVSRPGFIGPAKTWYLYLCRDFRGYNPLDHVAGY